MEQEQNLAMQEDTNLKTIEEEFKKAFVFVNKGLNTDELGQKTEARSYYRQAIDHLLKGITIPSQGPQCTGAKWDSARQMQQKMRETLQNVNTRLSILNENIQPHPTAVHPPAEVPKVYPAIPSKDKPERPPLPTSLVPPSQPLAAGAPTTQGKLVVTSPSSIAQPLPNEAPPAYTSEATDGHYTVSYGTDSGEVSSVGSDYYTQCTQPPPVQSFGVDADELILIPHGVQIFYVTPDGQVSAPSYPGYLRIVKFLDTDEAVAQNRPPAFLQVCDWLYPLMCNQSPVLSCNTGIYMFPDMMSQESGSYVGVVLSLELPVADRELFDDLLKQMTDLRVQVPGFHEGIGLPSEYSRSLKELFEDLLKQRSDLSDKGCGEIIAGQIHEYASHIKLHVKHPEKIFEVSKLNRHRTDKLEDPNLDPQGPAEASSDTINLAQTVHIQPEPEGRQTELPDWSEKVAHGILSGASWVSWGLVKGAEFTGKAIHKGAAKLREHLQPEEKPAEVSPTVSKGLQVAKQATGGAVKVSQFLVEGVCSIASCVGRELAPHVKKHGSKLVPESLKKDKDGKSTFDGALVVAASGVQGFSTIWQGLESAAKCIAKSVSKETVQTVKHKYGDSAGHATDDAMSSAINVGVTAFNIDNIGIKAMVKKTAKETGHAVLDEYKITEKKDKKEEH